jgi:tetrathionate reductase subunit A
VLGREIRDEAEGFDLHMITYREISQTKSRTVVDYWLNAKNPIGWLTPRGPSCS